MPDYGSTKKNVGSAKIKDGTEGNYDMGVLKDFGPNKGARNRNSLNHDEGGGGGQFKDTDNDANGDGFGGNLKKPRAGDA